MQKRQVIIVAVAIVILLIGKFVMDTISTPAERPKQQERENITTVFTEPVVLGEKTIQVSTTGTIQAKMRMEIYSEVQGLMLPDGGKFKAGNAFKKGQTILQMRQDDAFASVVAQRSAFERSISSVMADIRIDYPSEYPKWSKYLNEIDANENLKPLPEVQDTQLKSFLTGRDVYTTYYNLRNAEIGLSRYHITAPFDGVLTQEYADPGTVIRQGQLLGVFLQPGLYEIQASTDDQTLERLAKGQKVDIRLEEGSAKSFQGSINRINASIDPATQMGAFFVEIKSDELKEGQFVRIDVEAETVENAYEINRSALKDSRYAFVAKDGELEMVELEILHTSDKTAIVRGLENGQQVLTQLPSTAFVGMKVKIYSEESAE